MNTLKISGLNYDILWKNKHKNIDLLTFYLSKKKDTDIIVLPEMFATGFCMDTNEIADKENEVLHWMQQMAKKQNTAITGSVSIRENNLFYNRMYFVKPDQTFDYYDKRHLFSYSGEDKIYTAGKERKIVEYKGWKILLQVCYDLRFPVFSRNRKDYDTALYVANWPKKRVHAWKHLLQSRAIENQAYVLGVNRIGTDGNGLFYPESTYGFFADGTDNTICNEQWIEMELDKSRLSAFREKFQFLNDGDDFEIIL